MTRGLGCGRQPVWASPTSDSLLASPRAHRLGDLKNVPLLVRWQPRPRLTLMAFLALVPAAALWVAALADSLRLTRTLTHAACARDSD